MLQNGDLITSPGGKFTYLVQGPVCRLYDREQLPYPCCRLQWRGKEPYWNRVGARFVLDMATKYSPSYAVNLTNSKDLIVMTLYWERLESSAAVWWFKAPRNVVPFVDRKEAA